MCGLFLSFVSLYKLVLSSSLFFPSVEIARTFGSLLFSLLTFCCMVEALFALDNLLCEFTDEDD